MEYSPEQIADIKEREQKALETLKELQLTPAVMMQAVNIGNDTFAMKPIPYLADFKFTPTPSIKSDEVSDPSK
jgi:hypothetical protein